ncbi:MAG: EF-hand domain-containing protein [Caulobacter sp.]|nr:EF-hand domain-containing protein [Caulobacter sp.]
MKTITLAAVLLTLSAGAALAQGAPGARMDVNGDGKVTKGEFTNARVTMMMRADANKDGKLSKAELETGMSAMRKGGAAAGKGKGGGMMFGMMDGNKDGFLTRAEIEKMIERRFQRIDVNGDGALSSSEMAAMPGGQMGGGGGGGR